MNTNNEEGTTKDPYGDFRHFTFQHIHYYLADFFRTHSVVHQHVIDDAGLGDHTLYDMLNGKDVRLNCYIRLLATMKMYCENDDRYMDFIMGFIKRAIVDVWLKWRLSPEGWMKEVWREMEEEKKKKCAVKVVAD